MNWEERIIPGYNCIDIIKTSFWDDSLSYNDTKIWWDEGNYGTLWSTRIIIN